MVFCYYLMSLDGVFGYAYMPYWIPRYIDMMDLKKMRCCNECEEITKRSYTKKVILYCIDWRVYIYWKGIESPKKCEIFVPQPSNLVFSCIIHYSSFICKLNLYIIFHIALTSINKRTKLSHPSLTNTFGVLLHMVHLVPNQLIS